MAIFSANLAFLKDFSEEIRQKLSDYL